ncbi:TetR/AcrR family transcriptional regulator [Sanguibacter sp. A247]|uniref:TetR/AcrR family transcriptional regulator n=1 Tax=unclassified Sanguibacter TaxID=2645534 RepID=UPI003FD7A069
MEAQQRYHHGSLREALLAAGRELLAERGPDGFSLSELARRVGVSTAAPYRHFEDRDAILDALAAEGYAIFDDHLRAAIEGAPDPAAALARAGVAYLRFSIENPAVFRVMFHNRPGRPTITIPTAFTAFADTVTQAQHSGFLTDQIEPHVVVRSLWSAIHGAAVLHATGGFTKLGLDAPLEQIVDGIVAPYLTQPRSPAP